MACATDRRRTACKQHRVFVPCRYLRSDRYPNCRRRGRHGQKYAHNDGNDNPHHKRGNFRRNRNPIAKFIDKLNERIGNEYAAKAKQKRTKRNEQNVQLSLPCVQAYDFNHEHRRHVRADGIPRQSFCHHRANCRKSAATRHQLIRPSADHTRYRRRKDEQLVLAQRVRNPNADTRAHQNFCKACYVGKRFAHVVIPD